MEVNKNRKGFSLVELAIVIIIIGMLFALGLKMLGPMVQRLKHTDTKESINAAVEAVVGFAAVNNRLPECDNTFITAGGYCAGDGVSDNTYDEFLEVVRTKSDVWDNDFIYIPADQLLDDDTVCERATTSLELTDCGNSTDCSVPEETVENVAFIVISKGENMNLQSYVDVAVMSDAVETYNPGLLGIDEYPADIDRDEPYKDIVTWMTLEELRVKAGCLGGQLRVLTDALPACQGGTPYSAKIFADGGIPWVIGAVPNETYEYKWCREETGDSGLVFTPDPLDADCENEVESGAWTQSDIIEISGEPRDEGSYNLTFWVRDNNESGVNDNVASNKDNIESKSIILTIGPSCLCDVDVENNSTTSPLYYKYADDDPLCEGTFSAGNGNEITVTPGEHLYIYSSSSCTSGTSICDYTHKELHTADTDEDCEVQLANTGECDLADE